MVAGTHLRTEAGWVELQEVFDTECYEPVYNLRVAEYHTYFVGAEEWESGVWAHNAYTFALQKGAIYNYATGSYEKVTNQSGYSATWWVPAKTTPSAYAPALDNITKLGNQLTEAAQKWADAWTNQTEDFRYDSYLNTVNKELNTINGFLPANQQITLNQIDVQGARFPTLDESNTVYNKAVRNFWFQRSVAIGQFVHTNLNKQFQGTPGLTYTEAPKPGPDFKYVSDTGRTVYFEVLPNTTTSLRAHAERSMNAYLYRAVFYNRNAINNPGSQEPGAEIPSLGNT